jgi:hypothetical protein
MLRRWVKTFEKTPGGTGIKFSVHPAFFIDKKVLTNKSTNCLLLLTKGCYPYYTAWKLPWGVGRQLASKFTCIIRKSVEKSNRLDSSAAVSEFAFQVN